MEKQTSLNLKKIFMIYFIDKYSTFIYDFLWSENRYYELKNF